MIDAQVRRWLPAEGGLIATLGLVPRIETIDNLPDNDPGSEVDLDTLDPALRLPGPDTGFVAVIARTVTDLRRAASLAAMLPSARQVLIAVIDSRHRPIGVPKMSPELHRLRSLRTRYGSDGEWAVDMAFSRAVPAGLVVAAVVRGLGGHRPLPIQRVALAGAGSAHWRPADPDAILAPEGGPLDVPDKVPPADLVLRTVAANPVPWTDTRVTVIDRPQPDRLSWANLGRPGARNDALELLRSIQDVDQVPPVDEYSVNPTGYVAVGTQAVAELQQVGDCWMIIGDAVEPFAIHPSGNITDADVARLRPVRALNVAFGRHTGPVTAVRAVAGLACAGIPLVATGIPPWAAALGADVIQVLTGVRPNDLEDDLSREVHSIRLRRAAIRTHSSRARWRNLAQAAGLPSPAPPRVSVLLCTMRSEYIGFALTQIARQRDVDLELVLILHNVPRDLPEVRKAVSAFDRPITVVEVEDGISLGAALNRGADVASGQLLAKWDDDDWYGPEHLADLVLAQDYSGAELVGCSHELTYLQQINLTVFHPTNGSEQFNRHVAGCTLLIDRHVFQEVSGFRPVARREDMSLQRAVIAAGGRTYRTHGLGYVVNRRETGHSWAVPITHFMRNVAHQWRGLHLGPLIATDDADSAAETDARSTRHIARIESS